MRAAAVKQQLGTCEDKSRVLALKNGEFRLEAQWRSEDLMLVVMKEKTMEFQTWKPEVTRTHSENGMQKLATTMEAMVESQLCAHEECRTHFGVGKLDYAHGEKESHRRFDVVGNPAGETWRLASPTEAPMAAASTTSIRVAAVLQQAVLVWQHF